MSTDQKQRSFLDPAVVAQLGALPLLSRKPMLGNVSGRHSSPHRGASVEFAEYRKYVPGDDLRRLDWRAYGRSDRFYIKEFEADTNLRMVVVLDTSGSMDALRLECMQDAAKRVLDTLTFSDRVAIVSFATRIDVFARDGKYVYQATEENKAILREAIDGLEAIGSTNFLEAFEKTFEILDDSIREELVVTCGGGINGNTAILFLTDGEVTEPDDWTIEKRQDEVERVVAEGLADLEARTGRPPYFFTFSISENSVVHEFPKRLACTTTWVPNQLV